MTGAAAHAGAVLWFTGLSGAGKSTLARASAAELLRQGYRVEVLDGDMVREQLSRGLGFTREDRRTNVLRIAYVAHLLARNGVHVCVAAISPFLAVRQEARAMIRDFVEVHVATPLEVCMDRDVKGLYARAKSGHIADFTGISQPYEPSATPELRIDTSQSSIEQCVSTITTELSERGYLRPGGSRRGALPHRHARCASWSGLKPGEPVSKPTMIMSPLPSGPRVPFDLLEHQPTYLGRPYFAPLGVRVSNQEVLSHLRGGVLPEAALAYMTTSGSIHRYLDYEEVPIVATAARAVMQVLEINGIALDELDAVIYGGMFRDNLEPSTAAFVALELEMPRIKTLDVTSACSGMAHAVEVASGWLAANPRLRNIALTSVETPYRYLDWNIESQEDLSSKGAGLTIGAGVSALIVSRTRPSTGIRLRQFVGYDDASVAPMCKLPIGGVFTSQSHHLMRPAVESIRQVKKDAAKWVRPSMWVLPHQPFGHVNRFFTKGLRLNDDRIVVTHSLYGNTVASAWVSAYNHLMSSRSGDLAHGDPVLIKTMAGGFSSLAIIGEFVTPGGAS